MERIWPQLFFDGIDLRGEFRIGNQVVGVTDAAHGGAALADDFADLVVGAVRLRVFGGLGFTARAGSGGLGLLPCVFDLRVVGDGAVRVGVGSSTAVIACAPIDAILFGFLVIRGFGQHVEYQIHDERPMGPPINKESMYHAQRGR